MATTFIKPTLIPQAFAQGGQHADLPNAATGTNRASFLEGFPQITSTPIADGGIPPNRLDFNALGYIPMIHAFFRQNGGVFTFDTAVSNAIGGYPKGAVLWVLKNNVPQYAVRSLVENNTNNFVNDPSLIDGVNWQKLTINPAGDSMTGTMTNVNDAQIRNIEIVNTEPETGVDGTVYGIIEQ